MMKGEWEEGIKGREEGLIDERGGRGGGDKKKGGKGDE